MSRKRSRISSLKAPFVVTVAVVGMGAGGCTGNSDSAPTGNTANSANPAECPTLEPTGDAVCAVAADVACNYNNGQGQGTNANCAEGKWVVNTYEDTLTGNPPEPEPMCPDAAPTSGDLCWYYGESCGYGDCYGTPTTDASCVDGSWLVSIMSCNPPMPEPDSGPIELDGGPPDGAADAESAECPEIPPTMGEPCSISGQDICGYNECLGYWTTEASCVDSQWSLMTLTCNPPMPMPDSGLSLDAGDGG
ncbi:MAG: hypothetical protein HRU17_12705 [Polyangiaceae bacterium]|nr:hypothetical protein [Polyangiaceae bacterium]